VATRILPPLSSAATLISQFPTLSALRQAAAACQACDLWQMGAQTVFGEGEKQADVMLVGEQPGDQEDRVGRPFVGPAGQLLDQALSKVGIERDQLYVTNIVKHFKWELKGKRRIHQTPNVQEISACRPWLDTEIR
jgi:DNA polymerase